LSIAVSINSTFIKNNIKDLMIEEFLDIILAKQFCFDHFEQTNNYFLLILVFF